ncbi:MAG: hypothetical protein SGI72_03660 [Planctomycetota bacterium]|nr:hypothetical protein [Planctomycetota bacterium]
MTAKYGANGNLVWLDVFEAGPTSNEDGRRIRPDPAGRATVFGNRFVGQDTRVLAQSYERDGSLRWRAILPLVGTGYFVEGIRKQDGGFVVGSINVGGFQELRDQSNAFCFGDGASGACSCGNSSAIGAAAGCSNSVGTAASLVDSGAASLTSDASILQVSGVTPTGICSFIQGNTTVSPTPFGDGLRCAGGVLERLYLKSAQAGVATVPTFPEASVSQRSAFEGDPLSAITTRAYQVFCRDSDLVFCAAPRGNSFNMSSGLMICWVP